MSTPSIKVGQGNWGIKAGNLLGYANTDKKFVAREFTVGRLLDTATRVNASGNIEIVNANIPRIDYFGGQASLLVEPSGTNSIRNNSMVGAVTGTPGTLPTGGGWATVLRGLTQTVVGTGTENGINYIDIRFSGTATSTDLVEIRYESNTQIVASSGQTWAHSVYLKKIVEPNPPNNYQLAIYERDSGGGFVAFGASTIAPTTTIQRFTQTRTLSGALTARVQPGLFFGITNLQSYDFTIRIGYPQMELSSVATSVIPTTTGAVTRNADVVSVTGVAGLIGQTEGTIYVEFINTFSSSYNDGVLIRVFSDANNEVFGRKEAASNRYTFRWRANSQNTTFTSVNVPDGVNKVAIAYKSGDTALFLNGVQIGSTSTDVRAFSVNPTTVALGSNGGAGQFFNDRIRAASIYQTRLPNTTTDGSPSLQSITTL